MMWTLRALGFLKQERKGSHSITESFKFPAPSSCGVKTALCDIWIRQMFTSPPNLRKSPPELKEPCDEHH